MAMKLLLNFKLENLFKSKDFTDKKSGEVTKGKWKAQLFDEVPTEIGVQRKNIDVSISYEDYLLLKDKVGKDVSLNVGTYIVNNKVGFYGLNK